MDNKKRNLPIAKAEDVEFSREVADQDDDEALQRAAEADKRAEKGRKNT